MNPTTTRLLEVLAALDDDVLVSVYDITRCNAPLDAAVYAWRDAGCPDLPRAITPEDANAAYRGTDEDSEPEEASGE